jgi:phosphinothricin acetyltransferase
VSALTIRPARLDDAAALVEIYRPVVLETTASFELEPPSVEQFRERIAKVIDRWVWLVAEDSSRLVGYAYATPHRSRAAYRYSIESSVYVAEAHQGRGIARRLYTDLFDAVIARGFCHAYAGITLPNDASVALHESFGFSHVGVFRSVGRKFGAWHDVSWWHKPLRPEPMDG